MLSQQSWPEEECVAHLKISACSFIQRMSSLQNLKRWASELRAKDMLLVIAELVTAYSDREFPMLCPHIHKVKYGGFELFSIEWARQFTQTSAQMMIETSMETQQREQQKHACSQFLTSLLPWRALETSWQSCNCRAKIGCTKSLSQKPILGSLPVCWSPVLSNAGQTQGSYHTYHPHWKQLGEWLFVVSCPGEVQEANWDGEGFAWCCADMASDSPV